MPYESSNFTLPDTGDNGMMRDPVTGQLLPVMHHTPGDDPAWGNREADTVGEDHVAGTSGVDRDVARYRAMGQANPAGPQIDRTQSNETRGLSMGALGLLGDRANGAETPAQALARQQTMGAASALNSSAASVKGGAMARAAAARGAVAGAARVTAQGNQDLDALRAREMADASGQYFGAASGQRGIDLGLAQSQAQLEMGQRGANLQNNQFYEGLGFDTKNAVAKTQVGMSRADQAAANSARTANQAADATAWNNTKDAASAATGAVQGGISAYGTATAKPEQTGTKPNSNDDWTGSDERMKSNVMPLYEPPGSELHMGQDGGGYFTSLSPDVTTGASLSGPAPKYSKAPAPAASKAKAKSGGAERKMTDAELERAGNEMLANVRAQSAAQLGAGSSVGRNVAARARELAAAPVAPAQPISDTGETMGTAGLHAAIEQRAADDARGEVPMYGYFGDAPKGVTGAPMGYAAARAGHAGAMFGPSPDPSWTDDPTPRRFRDQYSRDIAMSDESTKRGAASAGDPMANANRSMAPSEYEYKPQFTPGGQAPGEKNVGPMANNMAADPVASTAIVRDPGSGLLAIDKEKGLKLTMGGLASLQRQVDELKRKRA